MKNECKSIGSKEYPLKEVLFHKWTFERLVKDATFDLTVSTESALLREMYVAKQHFVIK